MIHICFAYIFHYKALNNVAIKLDSHYAYHFDSESKILMISQNQNYPKDFWGRGVYSMAAIVGNNGAGKSTSMEFLLNALLEGANAREVDGVLVYEQDGCLSVWGQDVKVKTDITYKQIRSVPKIPCFYYSGHFMPYMTYETLRSTELSGAYNASDGWLLIKDLQSYSNIDSIHMSQPLFRHMNYFVAQNNHRICTMLADDKVRNAMKEFCLPKYVQIGINESGWYALNENRRMSTTASQKISTQSISDRIKIPQIHFVQTDARYRYQEQFIDYNFLNLINESQRTNSEEGVKALTAWLKYIRKGNSTLFQFESFIKTYECSQGLEQDLMSVLYVIKVVDELCTFGENGVTPCYYLNTDADGKKLQTLAEEILNKQFFLTAKFFDMYYSQELGMNTILSSGEQALLDLLSRLYDAQVTSPQKYGNVSTKRLVLLDEAEIGFHPEWQRRYINLILDFLQTMVVVHPGADFQVLISTHSPLLLSDIPSTSVNYLEVDENGMTRNADEKETRETFAANVFEQYKDSFFMKDGLVGEFACKKLRAVQKDIEVESVTDDTRKIIGMIGDVRIKDYLLRKITRQDIDAQIAYHEEKVRELKAQRRKNNE